MRADVRFVLSRFPSSHILLHIGFSAPKRLRRGHAAFVDVLYGKMPSLIREGKALPKRPLKSCVSIYSAVWGGHVNFHRTVLHGC